VSTAAGVAAIIQRKTAAVAKSLSPEGQRKVLTQVGVVVKEDVGRAVRQTPVKSPGRSLADQGMSGFGNVAIRGYFRWLDDGSIRVQPMGREYGQMSILESGRRSIAAGGFRRRRTRRRADGSVATGLSVVGQNVGAQAGKGTWTRAKRLMSESAPKVYNKAIRQGVTRAFRS
jgi:hypothetical protein